MWTPIIWLLNVLLFLSIFALSLAGCCSGKKNKKNKGKKGTAKKKGNHKASNKKAKPGTSGIPIHGPPDKSVGKQHSLSNNQPVAPANGNKRASTNDSIYFTLRNVKDPFAAGGEQGPSAPENATRKAEPKDPQYETLKSVQDVFANGGGGQRPAAPQQANVMVDTSDPNYKTFSINEKRQEISNL
uniref:Uncharacterized protein n=1 Tax=Acrobeloides nanus TaxID=290746 RepID=A0A914CQ08_9BILA